jgi:hypothetical protein
MIAVQVRNEDVVDACRTEPEPPELDLRTFPAIDQKKPLIHIQ